MSPKVKNGLHRNDINRTSPRHGHKYTKMLRYGDGYVLQATPKQHLKLISWKS